MMAAFASAGCSGHRAPGVNFVDARAVERSDEATRVEFTLELTNANDEPVPLDRFEYRLDVDGATVFESQRSAEATLRRLGAQTMALPAIVPHEAIGGTPSGPRQVTVAGKLSYIAPGELAEALFDTGVRVPSVSFSHTTVVDFGAADAQAAKATPVATDEASADANAESP